MTSSMQRRILIIDDQESIHRDYRKIIAPRETEPAGLAEAEAALFGEASAESDVDRDLYEIDSAYQGQEAVTLVQRALSEGRPYALAFCDIRMPPGCDGIQTIRQLWQFDPELLVVICSAYSDYDWEDIVRELGRTDRFLILRKPFENIEVRQCAAALTERWVIARTDALTGLLNRRAFTEQLRREWAYAVRDQQSLCCVMLDIDYFKTINDRYGHAVGDEVLRIVSAEIAAHKRPADAVCRYGGEEICLLMPNTDEQSGQRWAESLRQKIASRLITVGAEAIQITASFGVAAAHESTLDENQLVDAADEALRLAKQSGRDRVVRASEVSTTTSDPNKLKEYSALFSQIVARDIMTSHVVCVPHNITVQQAAALLLEFGVNSAPVVDDAGQLVGVVSEKDIMEALGSAAGWAGPLTDVMTKRVIHYDPATSAQVIFEFLCRVQLRRVIVVENGKPIGIIRRASFIRWIRNLLKTEAAPETAIDSRQQLLKVAESLANCTTQLCHEIQSSQEDVLYPVVSGVSSIEMVLSDLLLWAGNSKNHRVGEQLAECL